VRSPSAVIEDTSELVRLGLRVDERQCTLKATRTGIALVIIDYHQLRNTGTVDRRVGSVRPRSARTAENIDLVDDLIVSQEDKPQTHRTVRELARETGIHRSSAIRIIKKDLRLKCFKKRRAHYLTDQNCAARLKCSRLLLKKFPFPKSAVDCIFFTDEKVFSVASTAYSQNDRVYAPKDARKCQIAAKCLLHCRPNFSKSLMAVSKLGVSELFFVEPGVKVDGRYYWDVLLKRKMLPVMRRIAGPTYVFQQDSAPAHRACDTAQLLQMATPEFIAPDLWLPNSPDLNPVDYQVWSLMQ